MGRDGATRRAFCFARLVMAGLVPAIHVALAPIETKTWMPGTRPGMTKVIHFAAFSVGQSKSEQIDRRRARAAAGLG